MAMYKVSARFIKQDLQKSNSGVDWYGIEPPSGTCRYGMLVTFRSQIRLLPSHCGTSPSRGIKFAILIKVDCVSLFPFLRFLPNLAAFHRNTFSWLFPRARSALGPLYPGTKFLLPRLPMVFVTPFSQSHLDRAPGAYSELDETLCKTETGRLSGRGNFLRYATSRHPTG